MKKKKPSQLLLLKKRERKKLESKRNTIHNQRSPRNYLVRREQKKWRRRLF